MELKKGETIMVDATLYLPASFLHTAFSDRSGVPLGFFELYYRGKRLEGEAALSSWRIGKGSTIEVKMRGRGGMDNLVSEPQCPPPARAVRLCWTQRLATRPTPTSLQPAPVVPYPLHHIPVPCGYPLARVCAQSGTANAKLRLKVRTARASSEFPGGNFLAKHVLNDHPATQVA